MTGVKTSVRPARTAGEGTTTPPARLTADRDMPWSAQAEKITRQHRAGMGPQELPPGRPVALRCGRDFRRLSILLTVDAPTL
jgi:hypothetical protein